MSWICSTYPSAPNSRDNADHLFANSLALDQERRQQQNLEMLSQVDLPSFGVPTSPRQRRPRTAEATLPSNLATRSFSPDSAKFKKKKKGLGKLWQLMRRSKDEGRGASKGHAPEQPQQPQQEEDISAPLVPPPPIGYLMTHGVGGGQQRQVSTPSLSSNHPRSASQPNPSPGSSGALSPTTAPSSSLPSPTWRDSGSDDRKSLFQKDGGDQMPAVQVNGNGQNDPAMFRQSQLLLGMDDPKRALQVPSSGTPTPTGVLSSTISLATPTGVSSPPPTIMAGHNQQRPLSAMIHKSLPPLPPGETPVPNLVSSTSLPPHFGTPVPDMAFLPNGSRFSQNRGVPNAPFRTQAHERRQSSDGILNRHVVQLDSPPLGAQTMQPQRAHQQNGNGSGYDEMGYLLNDTVPIVKGQRSSPQLRASTSPKSEKAAKRRSRFGLSSLLGRKDKDGGHASPKNSDFASQERPTPSVYSQQPSSAADYDYQTLRNPSSDGMGYTNGGLSAPIKPFGQTKVVGSSSSLVVGDPEVAMGRPPSLFLSSPSGENVPPSLGQTARQPSHAGSVTSKRVEDLVARDGDFVAYRYPSTDQQFDLPRR